VAVARLLVDCVARISRYVESLLEIIVILPRLARTPLKLRHNYPSTSLQRGLELTRPGCPEQRWYYRKKKRKERERERERERAEGKLIKIPRGPYPRLIKTSDTSGRSIGGLILLCPAWRYTCKLSFPRERSESVPITFETNYEELRSEFRWKFSLSSTVFVRWQRASYEKVIIGKYLARVIRMRPCE